MADAWSRLGMTLAGMRGAGEDAYRKRLSENIGLGREGVALDLGLQKRDARTGIGDRLLAAGYSPEQAGIVEGIIQGESGTDYANALLGEQRRQELGFREGAVDEALGGNFGRGNAYLMGVANGPQDLAAVQGDILLGNRFVEGGDARGPTEVGQARIGQSNAAAANSYASAARTRQGMGIDAAEFGLKRAGQWNPGGASAGAAGGQKPIPTAALKELLGVEDAIGGTSALNTIIQKHSGRLANNELDLGPMSALIAKGRTAAGVATDADVALNEWNADLTRIVNESLRLNKGVQTEGDAQRAANELMSANDPRTAARALRRLAEFNNMAVQLQLRKRDLINSNYGRPTSGTDFGGMLTSPAAPTPAAAGGGRRRFNPATGRIE